MKNLMYVKHVLKHFHI
ncbi:unnamed protein product [Larinioides sclopetarius]|uniref:Uncharacterized protein n=1 Tax=Larinioides sclopetarius TaxID=280406 RepID=A0AAV1Z2S7_9ARAC